MSFDLQELLLDLPVDLLSICYQNIVDANNRLVRRVVCGTAESAVLAFDFSTTNEDDDGPIRFRAAWKSKLKGKIEQVLCSTWKGNPTIWALQSRVVGPETRGTILTENTCRWGDF